MSPSGRKPLAFRRRLEPPKGPDHKDIPRLKSAGLQIRSVNYPHLKMVV